MTSVLYDNDGRLSKTTSQEMTEMKERRGRCETHGEWCGLLVEEPLQGAFIVTKLEGEGKRGH